MSQQPEIDLLLSAIPTEGNSKTEAPIKSKVDFGLSTRESCSFRSQRTCLFYTGLVKCLTNCILFIVTHIYFDSEEDGTVLSMIVV